MEALLASWQWLAGVVAATALQAYLFLKKINKLEHRVEVLEKDQDELKREIRDRLSVIESDIKSLLRHSTR
jgi:hypothetical protein